MSDVLPARPSDAPWLADPTGIGTSAGDWPRLPPPPRDENGSRTLRAMRLRTLGALLGAAFVGDRLAIAKIGWYPPRIDHYLIVCGYAVAVAVFGWSLLNQSWRPSERFVTVTAAALALLPLVITQTVPSFKQLTQYAIPGGPVIAAEAKPTGVPYLYLYRGSPGSVTQLTSYRTGLTPPAISRDASEITFQDSDGHLELMVLGTDDYPVSTRLLTDLPGVQSDPSWSPDGTEILFDESTGYGSNLWKVRTDGSGLRQLTTDGSTWTGTWFPDGVHIIYGHSATGFPDDTQIWRMDADGGHKHALGGTSGDDFDPMVSPDGTTVLFSSVATGSEDVYTMKPDGTSVRDLTLETPSLDEGWSWADDGRYILFLSDRSDSGGTFLYYMKTDGSDVHLALII